MNWHDVVASLETSVVRRPSSSSSSSSFGPETLSPAGEAGLPEITLFEAAFGSDPLTGRPDRRAAVARLGDAIARRDGSEWAVAVIDLDGFQAVNYELGYGAGDDLLRATADRLRAAVRQGDLVCRFGSDEFAVLMGDIPSGSIRVMTERLLQAVAAPITLGELTICPQASAGVARLRDGHGRPEDVIREAERALGRAKTLGGGRCVLHDASLEARALALADLEAALRRALDSDDFRNHFEPIVSAKGGQVAGFEVLLWRKSTGARRRV
ncbi:MAG TPA: diguanylate cyclase [Vicinamibacteria bacterium]|nr:diguanylate cyclase [Vicinamibacteria bacterium]